METVGVVLLPYVPVYFLSHVVGTDVLKAHGVFMAHAEMVSFGAGPSHNHRLVTLATFVQWKFCVSANFHILTYVRMKAWVTIKMIKK